MSRLRCLPRVALVLACALLVPASVPAQTLMGFDGQGARVFQFNGPAGACDYPTGPIDLQYPMGQAFPCPTGGSTTPAPLGVLGGMANDAANDHIYVTNGTRISVFGSSNEPVNSFTAPAPLGPISAIAYDGGSGLLYATDGLLCVGLLPPAAPGCTVAAAGTAVFTVGGGLVTVTGMTWHGPSGELVVVDAVGDVWAATPGGAAALLFSALPSAGCGPLGSFGPLQSIAYDRSTPGALNASSCFYLTDGDQVAYVDLTGAPAVPNAVLPSDCFALPTVPLNGLTVTSRAATFGEGTDPVLGFGPLAGARGQFSSPSGPVQVSIGGAAIGGGTTAGLFFNFGPAPLGGGQNCPPQSVMNGNGLLLGSPLFGPLGGVVTLTFGIGSINTSIPAGVPPGVEVNLQWIVAKAGGGFMMSDGVVFVTSLP